PRPSSHPVLHAFPTRRSSDLTEDLLPMTDQPHLSPDSARRRRWVAAVVLLAAAGALVGAVYGIGSAIRNPDAAACRPAVELARRSEEHTSELQSRGHLVCRLL